MTDIAELVRQLQLAIDDHSRSFGSAPNTIKQKRKVIQIMLLDHHREILEALKIAAQKS